MGRFSTTVHIKNNVDRMRFVNTFSDVMKEQGFVLCSEDDAAQSYLFAFGEGWVTLTSEEYKDNPQKVYDNTRDMAVALKTSAFSVEVVDSDFAIIKLSKGGKEVDTVIVGDGSGYGFEEDSPKDEKKCWEPLLADGKTWKQLSEIWNKDGVFVEDALCESAPVLGIEPKYMVEDYKDLLDMADNDENIAALYFKEKAADKKSKPMTLNAAFKKVFGEALEPLGFKLIKSKYPYFVKVVSEEIVHYVTIANERADGRGDYGVKYKCFNVFCGVSTVYKSKIDFDIDPGKYNFGGFDSVSEIYTKNHWYDLDMEYRASIMRFYYNPTDENSLISALKKVLAAVEMHVLPVIGQAVTLEKCMDYFGVMEHFICPTLGDSGEGLLCTKLFSADEFVMFCGRSCEREIERCRRELDSNPNLNPKRKASLEERIEYIMSGREEGKKKSYEFIANPELQEKAPAELERRKKENVEKLRWYGLNI